MIMIWSEFIISAVIIVAAGTALTKYADIASDRYNLSKAWVGIMLLGFITSLPEIATSLVAIISFEAADLAVGNMLGSNTFNLMIIVILDILYRKNSITNNIDADKLHVLSAIFAFLLSIIVLGEITLWQSVNIPKIGHVSIGNILIALMYFVGVTMLLRLKNSNKVQKQGEENVPVGSVSNKKIFMVLTLSTIFIFIGAQWLTRAADVIAQSTDLGRTFVGSVFLAFATSLPEIVVSISALKLGSIDLAFGNIFGSNMINIFVIFLCDIFYKRGPILEFVSPNHIITVVLGMVLTAIVFLGINFHKKHTLFKLGWDSILMAICFFTGMGMLYRLR